MKNPAKNPYDLWQQLKFAYITVLDKNISKLQWMDFEKNWNGISCKNSQMKR